MSVTRRALLGAIAAASLAGCRPRRRLPPGPAVADRAALEAAIESEHGLLADYDDAIAQLDAVAAGPLTRARDRHASHVRALTAARGPSPTPAASSPPPPGGPVSRSALTTSLSASATTLTTAAIAARGGRVAALLASVAAEHATDAAERR